MTILFVNACVYPESRTKRLAKYLLNILNEETKEIDLNKICLPPLNLETLMYRTDLINNQNFDEAIFAYAKEYAQADTIVIAVPYWDLSFPAVLKLYIENININGIVFKYDENGKVQGLCKAQKLIYITTSGGEILSDEYGYEYIKSLAKKFHGINQVEYIKAEGLDIVGADIEEILQKAEKKIDKMFKND